jgi:hypothetical protein
MPVTSINLQTEFLLQFQKQREDSAILLASNRPQQEGQETNRLTDRQKGQEKLKERRTGKAYEQVGLQEVPHYNTRSKIILKTPKVEIPKRNFSLISNPLVLFRRIF